MDQERSDKRIFSPRKKSRKAHLLPRPCLDFEKMQQVRRDVNLLSLVMNVGFSFIIRVINIFVLLYIEKGFLKVVLSYLQG